MTVIVTMVIILPLIALTLFKQFSPLFTSHIRTVSIPTSRIKYCFRGEVSCGPVLFRHFSRCPLLSVVYVV